MRMQSSTRHLLGTASVLALTAAAFLASSGAPASAAANKGIYVGGSTLASEAFRQIFNCYTGATVGGDGFSFSSSFNAATPTPGLLPSTCTVASTVQGMYAGVGSGNGFRGFISNNPAQWYGGTVTPVTTIAPPFPASQPPYIDSANSTNFGSYPYPRVDIGLSDSPLAATLAALTTTSISFTPTNNWTATSAVTASGSSVVTYSTGTYGNPIQIPAFEVNVAIPINVQSTSLQINSQIKSGGNIVGGGAIQLTEGQMCAIFSGLVTDWNSTATIPYLDSTGAQKTANFYYANVGNGISAAQPYANASLPIRVVFRTDGSGTSFILTNYLKAVCPLLDPNDTYKYKSIFSTGTKTLPSNGFADLVTNIQAARGNGPWTPATTVAGAWVGASGSGGVQAAVGITSTQAGRIGYVSADFTKPYAIAAVAPDAASLQNEQLRIAGTAIPNTSTSLTFVAPTPAAADAAWSDTRLQAPATTWTWADYNIYNNTFTGTVTQGGVNVSGLSVLPLTNVAAAYPLSGTTFLALYSCYSVQTDTARVTNLKNFLNWYIKGADSTDPNYDAKVSQVIQNNGFHHIPVSYKTNIVAQYLAIAANGLISAAPASGTGTKGCASVTGGAL